MASPVEGNFTNARKRTNTASSIANSVASASQSAISFTEDLVLRRDPALGFFAATAQATSKAPTFGEIRRGSFGQDGWQKSGSGSSSRRGRRGSARKQSNGSAEHAGHEGDERGFNEPFAPLTEEPTRVSTDFERAPHAARATVGEQSRIAEEEPEEAKETTLQSSETRPSSSEEHQRTDHNRGPAISKAQRAYSSGYVPPPQLPWTTSTWIGLKAFWKWFMTPFGFLVTVYGLNVVAWGGMLFLLLCNASQVMCWSPVPTPENRKHMSDAAALSLGGPKYSNCNDINSPRRVWIEIDSQILNALFCVTGFGLVPWRFRDLYYLLRWRLTSEKKYGMERKMYGLRVLAGIHKGWFRLPGTETLDNLTTQDYLAGLQTTETKTPLNEADIEAAPSAILSLLENDPRVPLPTVKSPPDPPTSVRAPPTKLWKLDFFIWSQVWNTFFQCCLCGFMWGLDRYARPPWSTGLFVALACIIAGVGGLVSFLEGRKVKRVEGVAPSGNRDEGAAGDGIAEDGSELKVISTGATGHESIHVGDKIKDRRGL